MNAIAAVEDGISETMAAARATSDVMKHVCDGKFVSYWNGTEMHDGSHFEIISGGFGAPLGLPTCKEAVESWIAAFDRMKCEYDAIEWRTSIDMRRDERGWAIYGRFVLYQRSIDA